MKKFKIGDKVKIVKCAGPSEVRDKHEGSEGIFEGIDPVSTKTYEVSLKDGDLCEALKIEAVVKHAKRGRPKGSKDKLTDSYYELVNSFIDMARDAIEKTPVRSNSKIPPCTETVTGRHWWCTTQIGDLYGVKIKVLPQCVYCGLVDDREEG